MAGLEILKVLWLRNLIIWVTVLSLTCGISGQSLSIRETNCTVAASQSAAWEIRNFTFDTNTRYSYGPGTAGKVSFNIKNTANGVAFSCIQGDDQRNHSSNHALTNGKLWYNCGTYCYGASRTRRVPEDEEPPLDTSFHFDVASKELSVTQKWTCGSNNQTTYFSGAGMAKVLNISCHQVPGGRPDQVDCSPIDVTVKASNVTSATTPPVEAVEEDPGVTEGTGSTISPFAIVPQVEPKILHDSIGCSKRSAAPSWTITDFFGAPGGGGVRFTLKNNALDYDAKCMLNNQNGFGSGSANVRTWFNCSRYDANHATYPYSGIYTTILYGGQDNFLGWNQTWYCNDENSDKPTVYSAYAETKFLLNCNQTRSCYRPEDGTPPYMTMSESCSVVDKLTLEPAKLNSYAVTKQQAIQDFTPRGYNCSIRSLDSVNKPVWKISDFSLSQILQADGNASRTVEEGGFWVNNTARDSDAPRNVRLQKCYDESSTSPSTRPPLFDGSQELICPGLDDWAPTWSFDYKSSTLTMMQNWVCDGLDMYHVNSFHARGSAKVNLQCDKQGNSTKCSVPGGVTIPMNELNSTLNIEQDTFRAELSS